jgi:amino acid transporter
MRTGSVAAAFLVWTVSGVLSSLGAACYAELGAAFPINGGEPVYLERAYGEMMGFLFEWTAVLAMKPGGNAIVLVVFADYVGRAIFTTTTSNQHDPLVPVPWIYQKSIAIAAAVMITFILAVSLKAGNAFNTMLTVTKLIVIAAIASVGIGVLFGVGGLHRSGLLQHAWQDTSTDPKNWAIAFYSALFTFDGWNNLNYVTGELKDPSRDLPLTIALGMPVVIVSYIFTNLAFYAVLPKEVLISSATVALDFAHAIFGSAGGWVVAFCVSFSAIGAATGSLFTGSRLIHATAVRGHLPSFLASLNASTMTPVRALVLQLFLTSVYILMGNFEWLVRVCGAVMWVFYGLCAFSVVVLRRTERHLVRPYKVPLLFVYVFLVATLCLLGITVWREPTEAILSMVVLGSGVVVWLVFMRPTETWSAIRSLQSIRRRYTQVQQQDH